MDGAHIVQEQVERSGNYKQLGTTRLRFSYLLKLKVKWIMTYCPRRLMGLKYHTAVSCARLEQALQEWMRWRLTCKNLDNSNKHLQIDSYRLIKHGLKILYAHRNTRRNIPNIEATYPFKYLLLLYFRLWLQKVRMTIIQRNNNFPKLNIDKLFFCNFPCLGWNFQKKRSRRNSFAQIYKLLRFLSFRAL